LVIFTVIYLSGKFTRVSSENYDEFLKALNVGFLLRKAANASTPVMEISENDGNWQMKTATTMKTIELKFKLGVPFTETTSDGRNCETTVSMDGNKLITSQKATKKGEKDVQAVREFHDDKIVMTMTCDGVSATQVYKRDA
jgi:fatty acid-binding protein 3